ncbi:hypothetical protein ABGB12_03275 [Actinocorallia sp. B10E7]|uniref:hypothetical protein n=1 Tax=Actinocorallia sp. B10E7 TaxID=3153558 RepID=UPI00325DE82B
METHITNQPARARTDLGAGDPSSADGGPVDARAVRLAGLGLTTGALCWAAATLVLGSEGGKGAGVRIVDLTGLLFQLGVFCLLWVQMRTRAIGTSRAARIALRVEAVFLGLAAVWSLLHGVLPRSVGDDAWLMTLDLFWPLSMLGMAIIGVKLAFAARWRGALRWWPLIAESWALVAVPSYAMFGAQVSGWVGGTHLIVGYAALGVLLARNPHLTSPRQ